MASEHLNWNTNSAETQIYLREYKEYWTNHIEFFTSELMLLCSQMINNDSIPHRKYIQAAMMPAVQKILKCTPVCTFGIRNSNGKQSSLKISGILLIDLGSKLKWIWKISSSMFELPLNTIFKCKDLEVSLPCKVVYLCLFPLSN